MWEVCPRFRSPHFSAEGMTIASHAAIGHMTYETDATLSMRAFHRSRNVASDLSGDRRR